MWQSFNVNHKVRVRLTNEGRRLIKENLKRVQEQMIAEGVNADYVYKNIVDITPKEDVLGWSEWQMWHFMQEFGQQCLHGENALAV